MIRKLFSLILVACILSLLPLSSAAAAPPSPVTVPVAGTFTDAVGGAGVFVGSLNVRQFRVVNNQVVAVGTLTGTLRNSLGAVVGTILRNVQLAVSFPQATCDILSLELGPLDLDLLGLQVHLDRIVLDIVAQAGAGNLLGNLLCAIAGLLDAGGPLNQLVNLLNQILALL